MSSSKHSGHVHSSVGFLSPAADSATQSESRFFSHIASLAECSFAVRFWSGEEYAFGQEAPGFTILVNSRAGFSALRTFDEIKIAEAYVTREIDVEGDMLSALNLRFALSDKHPILERLSNIRPKLFGQVREDRKAIGTHYEFDDEFYLTFLDESRVYSQAVFEDDEEQLEDAMQRKLDYVFTACKLQPGMRVLDVGGGWGGFTQYAGNKGVEVTSLTIAEHSYEYIARLIEKKGLPCKVINENFLRFKSEERYDAIVIMGVIEHMPVYARVVSKIERLLKPNGFAYLDGSATTGIKPFNLYFNRYIFPGNHRMLLIDDFISRLQESNLELLEVHNDRHSYYLTAKAWAEKLDAVKDEVIGRFGDELYRKFRLYLWGGAHAMLTNRTQAYRLLLTLNPGR